MWGFVIQLAIAVGLGALAAIPSLVYYRRSQPTLARNSARLSAYLVAAIPALIAIAVMGAFVSGRFPVPAPYAGRLLVLILGLACLWQPIVRWSIRLTGGPAPRDVEEDLLEARAASAEAALRRGDLKTAVVELDAIAASRDTESRELAADAALESATLRRWIPTTTDLRAARRRLAHSIARRWKAPIGARLVAVAGIVVPFAMVAVPLASGAYTSNRACVEAEALLPGAVTASETEQLPMNEALGPLPEPGTVINVANYPLDLDAAAESRHDPDTRDQLLANGFVRGYQRIFTAGDGQTIQVDAFDFDGAEGAVRYQRQVTRYACTFSNLAFDHSDGGIGLQVRYASGDPIVEQVSWVSGARRYLVMVSLEEPPPDHHRIIDIASVYR